MKKMMAVQVGYAQVEVYREFLVEVPDDCDQDEAAALLEGMEDRAELEDAEWMDDGGTKWVGYDVSDVEIYDLCEFEAAKSLHGMMVFRLGDNRQ